MLPCGNICALLDIRRKWKPYFKTENTYFMNNNVTLEVWVVIDARQNCSCFARKKFQMPNVPNRQISQVYRIWGDTFSITFPSYLIRWVYFQSDVSLCGIKSVMMCYTTQLFWNYLQVFSCILHLNAQPTIQLTSGPHFLGWACWFVSCFSLKTMQCS